MMKAVVMDNMDIVTEDMVVVNKFYYHMMKNGHYEFVKAEVEVVVVWSPFDFDIYWNYYADQF